MFINVCVSAVAMMLASGGQVLLLSSVVFLVCLMLLAECKQRNEHGSEISNVLRLRVKCIHATTNK